MKRILRLTGIFFLFGNLAFAQPINDQPCNAIELSLDAPAQFFSGINETTFNPAEKILAPPYRQNCDLNFWCDPDISNSIWFKFTATTEDWIQVDLCGSTFDTQLALYQVGDCADFATYELIWWNDDAEEECPASSTIGGTSQLTTGCLELGAEYYCLVDLGVFFTDPLNPWQLKLELSTLPNPGTGPTEFDPPFIAAPTCPGGNDGKVEMRLRSGTPPIRFAWSTGDTTRYVDHLSAGTYTCTLTDNCGLTSVQDFTVEEASLPPAIVFAEDADEIIHPKLCGTAADKGQLLVKMSEGRGPFKYEWSTADTTALLSELATGGVYTVTVTDVCGTEQATKEYALGITAGPDDTGSFDTNCRDIPIGVDLEGRGGVATAYSYNTDQTLDGGILCRRNGFAAHHAFWRAFDLAQDFGVTGAVNVAGIEVFLLSEPNAEFRTTVPVAFTLYQANTTVLNAPDLELVELDKFETAIPEVLTRTSYTIPFFIENLQATDILVVKLEVLADAKEGHRFDFAANITPTSPPTATYITSDYCQVEEITPFSDFGIINNPVINLFLSEPGDLSYAWSGGGQITDPNASNTTVEIDGAFTFTLTVTDATCGLTVEDEMEVTCFKGLSTDNLAFPNLRLSPNPSSGHFTLDGEVIAGEVQLALFNGQGQAVWRAQRHWSGGSTLDLDLSSQVPGTYFLRFTHQAQTRLFRLVLMT